MRWLAFMLLASAPLSGCLLATDDLDLDGFSAPDDCDDHDPSINRAETDLPQDGIDQNCDGADTSERAIGSAHECDLLSDESLHCEGDDTYGQVSDAPAGQFVEVVAGDFHSCALTLAGEADCWGRNDWGQSADKRGPFIDIGAGPDFSWGRTEIGYTICWGRCGRVSSPVGTASEAR
jgi:hypothetical protein